MQSQSKPALASSTLVCAGVLWGLLAPTVSWSQSTPTIIQIPATGAPPPPAGMKVTCLVGPDSLQ
jgi:hypothetical protein